MYKRQLSTFAEAVLARARQSGDERSAEATRAWAERSSIDAETFASLATGMSTAALTALSPGNDLMSWLEVERENPELNELAIAARSTHGRLTPASAAVLLHRIRQEHGHFSDRLQAWTAHALQAMRSCLDPAPFAQGIQVARSLRSAFLDAEDPVDVVHVLELLDVSVDRLALDASSIEALAEMCIRDSFEVGAPAWCDINKDGLLEIVAPVTDGEGALSILVLLAEAKNDAAGRK